MCGEEIFHVWKEMPCVGANTCNMLAPRTGIDLASTQSITRTNVLPDTYKGDRDGQVTV